MEINYPACLFRGSYPKLRTNDTVLANRIDGSALIPRDCFLAVSVVTRAWPHINKSILCIPFLLGVLAGEENGLAVQTYKLG